MSDAITATIRYVQRDPERDPDEKPYILHYAAPNGFPQNNFKIKPVHGIKIHNLRTAGISYEEHGLKIASIDSSNMRPEDFDNDDWVESVYLPELHRAICEALGARDLTVFDWMLRKRAPSFPVRKPGEENEESHQPSLSAHIGERYIPDAWECRPLSSPKKKKKKKTERELTAGDPQKNRLHHGGAGLETRPLLWRPERRDAEAEIPSDQVRELFRSLTQLPTAHLLFIYPSIHPSIQNSQLILPPHARHRQPA